MTRRVFCRPLSSTRIPSSCGCSSCSMACHPSPSASLCRRSSAGVSCSFWGLVYVLLFVWFEFDFFIYLVFFSFFFSFFLSFYFFLVFFIFVRFIFSFYFSSFLYPLLFFLQILLFLSFYFLFFSLTLRYPSFSLTHPLFLSLSHARHNLGHPAVAGILLPASSADGLRVQRPWSGAEDPVLLLTQHGHHLGLQDYRYV